MSSGGVEFHFASVITFRRQRIRIAVFCAEQDQQALIDYANGLAIDGDAGLLNALK